MITVAITGGIGSGKSAVCRILSSLGVPVYDSDSVAKRLYDQDNGLVSELERVLGTSLRANETCFGDNAIGRVSPAPTGIDRKKLAGLIFSSPRKLSKLESIVHPAVLSDFNSWKACQSPVSPFSGVPPMLVIESAIVLERPIFRGSYDASLFVDAPMELRIARACVRDSVPEERIRARMEAQVLDKSKADVVMVNDGGLPQLRLRTEIALREITSLLKSK